MLLTITTTHSPATDRGYLLHKNPASFQTAKLPFGEAHVFFTEASDARCTAAVLLDVDPVGLVRRSDGGSLRQYVNDRPYVASSLLSVALARLFGTTWHRRLPPARRQRQDTSRPRPHLADATAPADADPTLFVPTAFEEARNDHSRASSHSGSKRSNASRAAIPSTASTSASSASSQWRASP
jgi:hypothetical protein